MKIFSIRPLSSKLSFLYLTGDKSFWSVREKERVGPPFRPLLANGRERRGESLNAVESNVPCMQREEGDRRTKIGRVEVALLAPYSRKKGRRDWRMEWKKKIRAIVHTVLVPQHHFASLTHSFAYANPPSLHSPSGKMAPRRSATTRHLCN